MDLSRRWFWLGLLASLGTAAAASAPPTAATPENWNLSRLQDNHCDNADNATIWVACNSLFTRKLLNEISRSSSTLADTAAALKTDANRNHQESLRRADETADQLKTLIGKLDKAPSDVTPALSRIAREIAQSRQAYEKALAACTGQGTCGVDATVIRERLDELTRKVDQIRTEGLSAAQRSQAMEDSAKKQAADAKSPPIKAPSRQLDPKAAVTDYYPDASFDAVLIAVPDPRVPRHRRSYEYSLEAIISGMSIAGFDIDRYYFPWQEYAKLDAIADSASDCTCRSADCSGECFGLITFRRDTWRDAPKEATRKEAIRLAYLVPETTTYGIPKDILQSIREHRKARASSPPSVWHPRCGDAQRADERMLIVGPSYSGSVNSWSNALSRDASSTHSVPATVCFLSYAATATSNERVQAPGWQVSYQPLARTDEEKIGTLFSLLDLQNFAVDDLAFVYEESTYGVGIRREAQAGCKPRNRKESCENMRFVPFLSNLSEIRARRAAMSNHASPGPLGIAARSSSLLPLDDSVENGSEYPTSRQSPLSSAAAELTLGRLFRTLNASGRRNPPRMIAIAATDVRDRLYLVQQLRRQVPSALLVDLEADTLLSHPDFVSATRGMLQLQSASLQTGSGDEIVAFQTDDQHLLRDAICTLQPRRSSNECSAREKNELDRGASEAEPVQAAIVGRDWLQPFNYSRTPNPLRVSVAWIRERAHVTTAIVLVLCWFGLLWAGRNAESVSRRMLGHLGTALCVAAIAVLIPASLVGVFVVGKAMTQIGSTSHPLDACLALGLVALAWGTRRWVRFEPAEADLPRRLQFAAAVTESWSIRLAFTGILLALFGMAFALPPLVMSMWAPLDGNQMLDLSIVTGVAVAPPFLGALTLCAIALMILSTVVGRRAQAQRIWSAWETRIGVPSVHSANSSTAPFVAVVCLGALLFVMLKSYPLAANAWAPMYDGAYYLSVIAATIVSSACLTMCVSMFETIVRSLKYVRWYATWQMPKQPPGATEAAPSEAAGASSKTKPPPGPFERKWSAFEPALVPFAITPILCLPAAWEQVHGAPKTPDGSDGREHPDIDTFDNRASLARLFSRWIWNIRSLALLIFLNCFGIVLLIYSYPVPSRDLLLLITMGIMVATSLFCVMAAIYFERDSILSRILCDRAGGIQWSWTFVITLVLPFLLLAIMILIAEVPGVREWTGSYLAPVLKLLGFNAG
ncbi:hypothetical protein [Dokdonella sp.]|uniref:hypothetical protein n=1 Tax=Dokdonella sp. TaxID=2291710 RepID=UPI001B2D26D1|nr:hypothetical protein [Dokdonella sp.]MBO9662898.1 hypothetical protein [Dokdonella sp.]